MPAVINCFDEHGLLRQMTLDQNYVADGSPFNSDEPLNIISLDQTWWLAMTNMLNQAWIATVAPSYASEQAEVTGDDQGGSFVLPTPLTDIFA
jgi:hypothetical protein